MHSHTHQLNPDGTGFGISTQQSIKQKLVTEMNQLSGMYLQKVVQ